ncbi:LPXTG cell wall anchor domain-containing protein [Jiangella ureilytica]|uniref:LPXTG cell wall anchor domain-containing protein n=1 Tax=Jiangella ureilytica TaxID=2530374 RepID=UPI00193D8CCD|nr:LPXTG cell wall anchor domain-containing protein [Jiangella ureilytica]
MLGTLPAAADHNEPDQVLDGNVQSCKDIVPGAYWEETDPDATDDDVITHPWFTVTLSEDLLWLDVELTDVGEAVNAQLAVLVKGGNQTNLFLGPDLTHLFAPVNASGKPAEISNYTICKIKPTTPTEPPTEEPTEPPTEEPTEPPTEEPTETPSESPSETPSETPSESPSETPSESPSETPSESPSETPTPSETPDEPELPDTGSSPTVLIGAALVLLAAGALALRNRFVKA